MGSHGVTMENLTCLFPIQPDRPAKQSQLNTYVGPPYCRTEMYAGRVACCPLVSHGEYADGTGGQTSDRYITLSA